MANKSVSPAAQQILSDLESTGVKIDLDDITGTGANGNITKPDAEAYAQAIQDGTIVQDAPASTNGKASGKSKKGKAKSKAKSKKADKAELDAAAAEVKKANDKKAKERKAKSEAKRKAQEKKKEERAKKKAEKERLRKEKEEAKAAAEAEQQKKDEAAFNQFQQVKTRTADIPLAQIQPESASGATSKTSASMDHLGNISALLLIELETETPDGYKYAIVDGSRRFIDAAERGDTETAAVIMPSDTDRATQAAARFLMNGARSQNVVHEARSMQIVLDETGWTLTDAAKYFDMALPQLSKTMSILRLPADFMGYVEEGRITASVAMELVNLDLDQQEKAREIFAQNGTLRIKDVRGIRKAAKEAQMDKLPDEATADGAGQYKGTGSGPLGLPGNATPEAVLEAAIAALLEAGLTVEDIQESVSRVASNMEVPE